MSLYKACVPQLSKMLKNLSRCLDKAEEFAKSQSFDPEVLLQSRLAPDQYHLASQLTAACDSAKLVAARLAGKPAPVHDNSEQTLEEVRKRIDETREFIRASKEEDFEGADQRMVPLPVLPGKGQLGPDNLNQMVLPNFYFHATTAYAILRHNGVPVGKLDFVGGLTLQDI